MVKQDPRYEQLKWAVHWLIIYGVPKPLLREIQMGLPPSEKTQELYLSLNVKSIQYNRHQARFEFELSEE